MDKKLIGFLVVIFALLVVGITSGISFPLKSLSREKPMDCPCNLEAYQTLVAKGQYITLLENAPGFAFQGKFVGIYPITVTRTGEITCGYLYIRVRGLDENYGSIYINLQDIHGVTHQSMGGHIWSTVLITQITEILLPLNKINVRSLGGRSGKDIDWVKVLNNTNKVKFYIALSNQNPEGMIEEIRIAYSGSCKLTKENKDETR